MSRRLGLMDIWERVFGGADGVGAKYDWNADGGAMCGERGGEEGKRNAGRFIRGGFGGISQCHL
jgi:hypothetical protein